MLKKFLIGTFVVVGLAFAMSASAAMDFGPTTLKVGSTGQYVMNLQTAVGATPVDGVFGPMTKAKVMAWQATNGLVADGLVGPATKNALNAGSYSGNTGTFPAGCTSAVGYSVTTGQSCSVVTTLPAGCTAGALFSSTTGQSCTGGSTPATPTGLTGGAGSITVDNLSTYSNEDVGEGDEDAKVLAFEVEADDESDIEVTSIKVELAQTVGTNSEDITDYIESVSVWMGGEMVGEVDAEDFSENNDIYTKFISLDGAVIDAGDTEKFIIAVTAQGNLDSGDINDDAFTVDVISVRFVDADGVVTTEDTDADGLEQSFDFGTFASANDVELEADLTNNPDEGVAIGDDSDETEILVNSFEFKADGSDINIESLEFDITTGTADTDIVAQDLILKWGDDEQTESVPVAGATTDDIVFDDLNIDIEEGDTLEFEVWATINAIDGTPAEGETIKVDLDVSETEATDESGEDLISTDLTGSANGETQHLYTVAPEITFVSSDIDPVDNGNAAAESATVELVFKVKALGGDIVMNGDDETTVADEAFGVAATGADTLSAYEFVVSGQYDITNSGADDEYYTIEEGDTMTVTITGTITQAAAGTVLGGLLLDEVQFGIDTGTAADFDTSAERSANVMNWADLLDDLKTSKTTLVGV